MSAPYWSLLLGLLLVSIVLVGTLVARLPLSIAMIYLGVGYAIGPAGLSLIEPDPIRHAAVLERVAEAALLISLFAVGLRMGVPVFDRRWLLPLRLAFVSMAVTVGLIAAVGVWGLSLPLGAAVLLGAVLAPTDPVLASGVQTEAGTTPDRVRFSLTGEGAMNDASAFPFVMLGLGLMGLHELGPGAWRWWAVDLLWAMVGGVLIGAACGGLIGALVVHLRTRHRMALGLDEFLSLGVIAIAYGAAQLCAASGFLAVFAAGLALLRVRERPDGVVGSAGASAAMTRAVQGFNEQLEKLAEMAVVLLVGAMEQHPADQS